MSGFIERKDTFQTAAQRAWNIICEKILSKELPPGTRLQRREMAKLTGVSIIPVIEALHRLESEGLVESRPYWGSRVIELTEKVIEDRYALREAVECQVVRILASESTAAHLDRLYELARRVDALGQEHVVSDQYWNYHYTFHFTLAEMTGHESLMQALRRINLFSLLQRAEDSTIRKHPDVPADNHQRIVTAIGTHDRDVAEREMRTHIYRSGLVPS